MQPPAQAPRTVAVVGAGPAGLYFLAALLDAAPHALVDVYESAPAPFGLVRYGVAPDHPRTRRISRVLAAGLSSPRVRYFGNVTVGRDVTLDELRRGYDAVVLATGMRGDRRLGIPGEHLPGSLGASQLVEWYTGHPLATSPGSLAGVRAAAVVGAGNVALDIARILARPADDLRSTSMPRHVLETLQASTLTDVHLIARRGPAFAKYTSPELHEIGHLDDVDVVVDPADLVLDAAGSAEVGARRAARIIVDLTREWAERAPQGASRRIHLHFWRRPVRVLGEAQVAGIELEPTAKGIGHPATLDVDLLVRAIGYHGTAVPGLPYDDARGVVPSREGRVVDGDAVVAGVYVTGWLRRGPTGVIGTNRPDAAEVAAALAADLDVLAVREGSPDDVTELLAERGVRVLSWADWLRLEAYEKAVGDRHGADPIVVHDLATVLSVLDSP